MYKCNEKTTYEFKDFNVLKETHTNELESPLLHELRYHNFDLFVPSKLIENMGLLGCWNEMSLNRLRTTHLSEYVDIFMATLSLNIMLGNSNPIYHTSADMTLSLTSQNMLNSQFSPKKLLISMILHKSMQSIYIYIPWSTRVWHYTDVHTWIYDQVYRSKWFVNKLNMFSNAIQNYI